MNDTVRHSNEKPISCSHIAIVGWVVLIVLSIKIGGALDNNDDVTIALDNDIPVNTVENSKTYFSSIRLRTSSASEGPGVLSSSDRLSFTILP